MCHRPQNVRKLPFDFRAFLGPRSFDDLFNALHPFAEIGHKVVEGLFVCHIDRSVGLNVGLRGK